MNTLPQGRAFIGVWLLLLILLGLTAGSSLLPLGAWNSLINLAVSIAKTVLIVAFFMELRHDEPLPRIVLGVALGMLAILVALSSSDLLTRHIAEAPWSAP